MALLVVALSATGCGRSQPRNGLVEWHYLGSPPGAARSGLGGDAPVAVLEPNHRLALGLTGSGSCPNLPVALTVVGRHAIEIRVAPLAPAQARPGALTVCTDDLTPTTSVIRLPSAVDTTRAVLVTVHLDPAVGQR